MLKPEIPTEHFLAAAEHLSKFGLEFHTDNYPSVEWATQTGKPIEGYIAANKLMGNKHAHFSIPLDTILEKDSTDEATVFVEVNHARISIHIPVENLSEIQNAEYKRVDVDNRVKIHSMSVV